jgi:AMMECR1 domain-containing protein
LRKVSGPEAVVVGRDGVRLSKDGRGAVYLPHVAVEQGWDRDEMLDNLCRKAGLPAGSWRKGAEFWTFQAEVFRESDAG